MPSIPHGLAPFLAPALAFAVALALSLLWRGKAGRPALPVAGAAAVLVGWAALPPLRLLLHAATAARTGPDLLLLPAAAGVALAAAAAWRRGRLERWAPVALAAFAGWWLARSSGGRLEFWRVWAATGAVAWVLSRTIAAQPARGLAAALALCGGLIWAGASPGWTAASAVAVAAWAGLLPAGAGAFVPSGLMAAAIVGADLGAGRLPRGGWNAADLTAAAALLAPTLAGALAAWAGKRAGRAGPALAGVAAAALAVGLAWLALRVLRPR